MAQTPVKIEIEGCKEREVLMVTYEFNKTVDDEGQLTGIPRGGKIKVRVKALNDGNPDFMAWVIDRNLRKKGKITFNETKTGKEMKCIEIDGAYCIEYHENWTDKQQHIEEIVMSCQNITFGNIKFENAWK